ncbi:MAG: TnpV protein [Christensenella sp.]|nr:TnpV protein [Christensenella sp.]
MLRFLFGNWAAYAAVPPFPQNATLRPAVRLQARSQRFAVTANFFGFAVLRHILWLKEKRKHHLEVSSNKTVCKNKLKAENQMLWVGKMNMCKARSEEIVKLELIYG